jgi:hypothetical protein
MPQQDRHARVGAIAVAASRRGGQGTGFFECAIFSFGGLAIAMLLIAHGAVASAAQLLLAQ